MMDASNVSAAFLALAISACVLAAALAVVLVVLVVRWPTSLPDHVRGMARGMAEAFEKGRATGHKAALAETPEPMTDFTEEMRPREAEQFDRVPEDEPVNAGEFR